MNTANDLFLLMLNLSQMREKTRVIDLFLEGIGELFSRQKFLFFGAEPPAESRSMAIATRNASYGWIVLPADVRLTNEDQKLLHNAVQMFAVILERLTFHESLEKEKAAATMLADERRLKLQETISELRLSRNASLNLIEDLTREIEVRQSAEAALRESEHKLKLILNNSQDAIGVSLRGIHIWVNPAYAAMFKYGSVEELAAVPVIDLIAPESRGFVLRSIRARAAGENAPTEYETAALRKDGSTFIMNVRVSLYELNGDNFTLVILRDITQRKQIEQALRESESRLRQIIDLVPHFIFAKDIEGRFILVNNAVAEAFGTTVEALTGKTEDGFADAEDVRRFREDDAAVIESGVLKKIPGDKITDAQGYVRSLSTVKIPFTTSGTLLPAVLGVSVDITEQKKAEAEAEQLAERLNQVQKLEALGVLAGGIAHDFNNLLGGVFGYLELARSAVSKEKSDGYLSKALATIERTRGLTNQLLTFAKGGAPLKKTEPLMPFVQETVHFALSGSSLSCGFRVQDGLWQGEFDRNQIGQVIDNIIINAIQAMPNGGTISVDLKNHSFGEKEHPTLDSGKYVSITIKDQGIGIPKEYIGRIFDPFYTTKPKGHGLGLATCYSIIHRHGGCIDVESEPGKGSSFHIFLPTSPDSGESQMPESASLQSGTGTILIMDDEEVIRETIEDMLKELGYDVISTAGGAEAVDRFQKERDAGRKIAGVIFDLTVPGGIGGKEAILEIRRLDAEIPAIVASGYAHDPVMADPEEYGFTASICKPFTFDEIAELLGRYLNHFSQQLSVKTAAKCAH